MSETKILTLDEAKQQIAGYRKALADGPSWARTLKSQAEALGTALNILARVEHSSEEDMAVLWLMREKGWMIAMESSGLVKGYWYKYFFSHEHGQMIGLPFNPTEEARKLGWKP